MAAPEDISFATPHLDFRVEVCLAEAFEREGWRGDVGVQAGRAGELGDM